MRFEIPDTDTSSQDTRCDCAHCDSRGRYEQGPDCRFYPSKR